MKKLLDILETHLTHWPAGVNFIAQDASHAHTGNIYGYESRPNFTGRRVWTRNQGCQMLKILISDAEMADDYKTAVVTKDDFTLATLNIGEVSKPNGVVDLNALRDRVVVLDKILADAKAERANIVEELKKEGLTFTGLPGLPATKVQWWTLKPGDIIRLLEETDDVPKDTVVTVTKVEPRPYSGSQCVEVRYNGSNHWPDADVDGDERMFDFELVKRA